MADAPKLPAPPLLSRLRHPEPPRKLQGVGAGLMKSEEPPCVRLGGSAAILAAVSGILPETLREHGLVFEIGVFPRRGFGKMPNPAAKMAALPEDKRQHQRL